jgi:hypothetical protein
MFDKQKKRFRVRSLLYYEEIFQVSSSCTLHLLKLHPKLSLNAKRAEHQETKTPNIKKQSPKHKKKKHQTLKK